MEINYTEYASPERSSRSEIKRQSEIIDQHTLTKSFLDSIPLFVCVLNYNRQIIYSNKLFKEYLQQDENILYGKRPGEAVECIHSGKNKAGCGTTIFCSQCGAVNSILESQKGKQSIKECRIILENQNALDLSVWSTPIKIQDENFTIFALSDIGNENRRKALERIFFHDILNTAGGISGFAELLKDTDDPVEKEEFINIVFELTAKLIDEIKAQRTISLAENSELNLDVSKFSSLQILEEVKMLYDGHLVSKGKSIVIDPKSINIEISSDKTILRRVIGNLLKNALEASREGSIITIGCELREEIIDFYIINPGIIPKNVQLQLFQRSFSTKGAGRGLGTYSVKLLTERYLKGKVNFVSNELLGTKFIASYPAKFDED